MSSVIRKSCTEVPGTGDMFEQRVIPKCKHIRVVLNCLIFLSVFLVVIMYLSSLSSSSRYDFEEVVPDGALYVCLIPVVVLVTPFLLVHFLPEDSSYRWITSDEITRKNILKTMRGLRDSSRWDNSTNN